MIPRLLITLLALLLTAPAVHAQSNPCGTVTISNADSLSVCLGDVIELRQTNTLTGAIFRWTPIGGLLDPITDPTPRIRPQVSGYYRVTATGLGGCTVSDSIYIDVDVLVAPDVIRDTTVCQGSELSLIQQPVGDTGNTNYTVLAGNATVTTATADNDFTVKVEAETTFTLVSRSENGACEERQRVRVQVINGYLDIPQDTVFACLSDDPIVLTVVDTPFMANREIVWSPARFNQSPPRGRTYTVRPVADITYYAEATINGCRYIDSVAVRLDSLPADLSMSLDPEKDPYCQGDTFYVQSPVYDAGDFPLIEHDWIAAPGLQSPRSLYNAVFVGQDTAVLQRVTRNGGCVDTSSITVNVVEPPIVTFDPPTPTVCPGTPVQINATFQTGSGTLKWIDPNGTLSCTDCLNPVATVETTTEYTVELITDGDECTTDLTYTIQVIPNREPTLTTETLLCPGDSRRLIVGNLDPAYSYRITGGGVNSTNPNLLVTPTETTTYTIETTGDCGTTSQTIELIVASGYTVAASGPATACASDPLTLSAAVNSPSIPGIYTWRLPNGTTRTGQEISITDPSSGTYTVTFRDEAGCSTATDEVTVEVLGEDINPIIIATLPDGSTLGSGDFFFAGNDLQLSVTNLPTDQAFTYSWVGSYSSGTPTGQTISVSVPRTDNGNPQPLVYTVTVTSQDAQCTFDATIFLEVQQSRVEVPDFFSPNADGRNDRFRLFFNGNITDYTMLVYDRWGQKVFTSDDPLEGWDGTKNGTPQPADVYLYLAKFRQDGVELQEEGQVTLVR